MQTDKRSIWIKFGPLVVASVISLGILISVSVMILNGVSDRLITQQAERESIAWAGYIGSSIERIEEISKGATPTETEREFLLKVRKFGDIFRYKLFDAKGHLRLVSDSLDTSGGEQQDLGEHNAAAARVLVSGKPHVDVHDGRKKSNRPDIYAEAYVPIFRNGKIIAISEVYVDATDTAALIKSDFATFGLIIAGLTLLVLLVPLWALRVLTVELQRRNKDLNTERARAVEAESAKSAFLAHMSHELRTPLNAIQGLSEMMVRGDLGPIEHPKYLEYSNDINFSALHLLKLVNDILDLSKIDAGKFDLQENALDLFDVVHDAMRIARGWSSTEQIELFSDLMKGDHIAYVDGRAIKQILLNLLSNAARFTPPGGSVTTSATLDSEGCCLISVRDTGDGIPEAELKTILEPFSQLRRPAGVQQDGTGLGLSLVKSMIELHGGTVKIESSVGEGTVVTISLPAERMRKPEAAE